MNRNKKRTLRNHIGMFLDISSTRMADDEANFLECFINNYAKEYKGKSTTLQHSYTDWGSEGKYTRTETTTYTFTDEPGIREDYSYQDDDGQSDSWSTIITDGRTILNFFKTHILDFGKEEKNE